MSVMRVNDAHGWIAKKLCGIELDMKGTLINSVNRNYSSEMVQPYMQPRTMPYQLVYLKRLSDISTNLRCHSRPK